MVEALVDLSVLGEYSDAQLRFELGVVRDLAAPLNAFIEAARRRLAQDPSWIEVALPGPHRHCDDVVLPDGTTIRASSFPGSPHVVAPDLGVYLDPAWQPIWPHVVIDWEDLGLPTDRDRFSAAINDVLDRARSGQTVEVGCLGGHGRTGTFLAVLAVRAGEPPRSAVEWVRAHYCQDAVETVEQEVFVETF
jgi:hypothetical protein